MSGLTEYLTETRGADSLASAKVYCNKLFYPFFRLLARAPAPSWMHSRWHWYRFPFSLRGHVLWSRSLGCWFCPSDETAIECMLRLPRYEPVEWLAPRPGDVVVDVGAYVGWYTIRAARLVGPRGHVVAFEPDSENRKQLERNIALNALSNITTVDQAAWSSSARLHWEVHQHAVWRRVAPSSSQHTVESVTIDEVVRDLSLTRLDWIKVDVEGAEVEALRGAAQSVKKFSPSVLVEVHGTLPALTDLLHAFRYSVVSSLFDEPPDHHGWILARAT